MIVVTAATGKLGTLVVNALLEKVPAKDVAVVVRSKDKAKALAERGVSVRVGDYGKPESLEGAFHANDRVLLISSSEVGQRKVQHDAVINAAKKAGVALLAYTSVLRANTSGLGLAAEHKATEEAIVASGLPHTFLRNGWYTENYTENLGSALAHGVLLGAAKDGKIAAATRADYAAAAVAVLTDPSYDGKILELGGDAPFTMTELAAEVARQSKKAVAYNDMPAADYEKALLGFGLPAPFASLLSDSDVGITRGDLNDDTGTLSKVIGRPTTSLQAAVAAALAASH
jgi:NAD(P)H dehydrogenase (quinone)